MSGVDRPGPPESTQGRGYEHELLGLRAALELPIVGQPRRNAELEELGRLIDRYLDEARAYIAELDGRARRRA